MHIKRFTTIFAVKINSSVQININRKVSLKYYTLRHKNAIILISQQ